MEQILALVQQILEYFQEGDAAAIVEMFKNFDFTAIVDAIKGIIDAITAIIG